jgi:DNA-binding CsgD family transcriptional regulator
MKLLNSHRQGIEHLRQLTMLGLGGPACAQTLFRELRQILSFDNAAFFWTGDRGRSLSHVFTETPASWKLMPLYSDNYFGGMEGKAIKSLPEALTNEVGPQHWRQFIRGSPADFFKSDFHGVMSSADMYFHMRMILRGAHGSIGGMVLSRRRTDPDFTPEEATRLGHVEHLLAYVLTIRPAPADPETAPESVGLLIVDRSGKMLFGTSHARAILQCVLGPYRDSERNLPAAVAMLVRKMCSSDGGSDVEAPQCQFQNNAGRFTFRLHWLDPLGAQASCIGVTVEHSVPVQLHIFKRLGEFSLSRRQRELALLIVAGRSESQAAQSLKLSLNTVEYHRKELYNRLGTESRHQLVKLLTRRPET